MMIGLSRLIRAIADVPKGGMQTGSPKVVLKLADAERIKAELGGVISERDALRVHVASLKYYIRKYQELGAKFILNEALAKTPQQCLREIEAKAGRAGFIAGIDALEVAQILGSDFDVETSADEYAATVRQGGE